MPPLILPRLLLVCLPACLLACKYIICDLEEWAWTKYKNLFPQKEWCQTKLLTRVTVSTYYFPTDDDEEGPTFKDKLLAGVLRGIDIFCVWDCCWLWLEFQKYVSLLVFDPFVELFITLCIVVNTLFMALDHHDMDKDMERVLKSGNYVSIMTQARQKRRNTPDTLCRLVCAKFSRSDINRSKHTSDFSS